MRTDFDKCHNLSKRNVKLILKVLSDLEPLRGSSNKKTLYSTRLCVNWAFFGTRGPLKWSTRAKKGPIYTQTRQINYYYIISGIKAILQDSSVKIADDEGVSPSSSVTHEFPVICFSPRIMYNILSTAANY
jgi:hypothetical protein